LFLGVNVEQFYVLPFDSKNKIIHKPILISSGSAICTIVHPREIFLTLIKKNAVAAILVHNHPSSLDPTPSEEDITLSKRIKSSGETLGIHILDHIIVGGGNYVSFTDSNLW